MVEATRPSTLPTTARSRLPNGANSTQPGPRSSYAGLTPRINASRAAQQANAARPYQITPKGAGPYKPAGGFGGAQLSNVASNPGTAINTYNHPAARINPQPPPDPTAPKTTLTPRAPRGPQATWNNAARAGANATGAKASTIARSLGAAGRVAGVVGLSLGLVEETNRLVGSTAATFGAAYNYGATGDRAGMAVAAAGGLGTAAAAGAGVAFGNGDPVTFGPGAAPGAGAIATGAAAAGAGVAALDGWLDPANGASPSSGTGAGLGTWEVRPTAVVYLGGSCSNVDERVREARYVQSATPPTVTLGPTTINGTSGACGDSFGWIVTTSEGQSHYEPLAGFRAIVDSGVTAVSPPPTAPTQRPVSDTLADPPSTRDDNPPRTPAPARTRTPGPTPTAPPGPPLTLPNAEPIPPGTLPNDHPLAAPTEAPQADPTAPPKATPDNVPNGTPNTAPSITPQPKPRETETPTGPQIVETPNGNAQVTEPPGGLSETPTGTTITTDQQPPELETHSDNWIIPPLLIGGGLAIGTAIAERVNNPTQPGQFTTPPKAPTPPKIDTPTDSKCKCNGPLLSAINGGQAATQAQLARIEANQNNPVSGFAALQVGQAGILGFLQTMNSFLRTAWEATRMQKVLDALTFIGVMHNVAMLSRNVGDTFFELISQALNVIGIEDENGSPLDVNGMVAGGIESFLRSVLGNDIYEGTRDTWNKASRILSSASMVIWTIRSIADTSLDLMEWIGENVSKIGNALKAWGVVGENAYRDRWMSERAQARNRMRTRFDRYTGAIDATEERLETFTVATSAVIEFQDETAELAENFSRFKDSVENGIPDPWIDNVPVATEQGNAKTVSQSPAVTATDAER